MLKRIRKRCANAGTAASAIAVYVGLTEIASEEGRPVFEATQSEIVERSGVKLRTVSERLADLKAIGVIEVSVPTVRAAGTFTLLSLCDKRRTICNEVGGKPSTPLQITIVKERKDSLTMPALKEWLDAAQFAGFDLKEAETTWNKLESIGWVDGNGNDIKDWRKFQCVCRDRHRERQHKEQARTKGANNRNAGIDTTAVSTQGDAIRRKLTKQSP